MFESVPKTLEVSFLAPTFPVEDDVEQHNPENDVQSNK